MSTKWYYKRWPVVSGLILLGPFAFPLLWKSRDFNLFWKVFLTLLFTAATIYMLVGSVQITEELIKRINEVKETYAIK